MGRAYKNFWSLNIDEAVVTGILRDSTSRDIEVFMPINAQMKDIDLVLLNLRNKRFITIQVKGSRAFEPKIKEIREFGQGSTGWFFFPKKNIERSKADYFIFLVYVIKELKKSGRRIIEPHTITIPTKKLIELCRKYKNIHGKDRYSFYFWVNPNKKEAFDHRDKTYYVNDYLDKKGLKKLEKALS